MTFNLVNYTGAYTLIPAPVAGLPQIACELLGLELCYFSYHTTRLPETPIVVIFACEDWDRKPIIR
jgi:hypothetical protein